MELNSNEIEQIVDMLQHADGEDMQEIIRNVGMEEQMLRQLIRTMPLSIVYGELNERTDLEI